MQELNGSGEGVYLRAVPEDRGSGVAQLVSAGTLVVVDEQDILLHRDRDRETERERERKKERQRQRERQRDRERDIFQCLFLKLQ